MEDSVDDVPEFLLRHREPPSGGLLSSVEAVLLSLLDDSGKIPSEERLQDFMAICTRIDKTEHRALSLEILRRHLCEELQRSFVSSGGFRLLRQWLEDAEEERQPAMLVATIRACRLLPFDRTAIKQAEIGKQIKKASRYEHGSSADSSGSAGGEDVLSQLAEEVKEIMREWREKQQVAIEQEKEREKERATASLIVDSTVSSKRNDTGVALVAAPVRNTTLLTALLSQQHSGAFSAASSASASVRPTRRARRPFDINEFARKLLERENERETERESERIVAVPALSAPSNSLAPMDFKSGGLNQESGSNKKEKKSIRWADDEGGSLKQVHMISRRDEVVGTAFVQSPPSLSQTMASFTSSSSSFALPVSSLPSSGFSSAVCAAREVETLLPAVTSNTVEKSEGEVSDDVWDSMERALANLHGRESSTSTEIEQERETITVAVDGNDDSLASSTITNVHAHSSTHTNTHTHPNKHVCTPNAHSRVGDPILDREIEDANDVAIEINGDDHEFQGEHESNQNETNAMDRESAGACSHRSLSTGEAEQRVLTPKNSEASHNDGTKDILEMSDKTHADANEGSVVITALTAHDLQLMMPTRIATLRKAMTSWRNSPRADVYSVFDELACACLIDWWDMEHRMGFPFAEWWRSRPETEPGETLPSHWTELSPDQMECFILWHWERHLSLPESEKNKAVKRINKYLRKAKMNWTDCTSTREVEEYVEAVRKALLLSSDLRTTLDIVKEQDAMRKVISDISCTENLHQKELHFVLENSVNIFSAPDADTLWEGFLRLVVRHADSIVKWAKSAMEKGVSILPITFNSETEAFLNDKWALSKQRGEFQTFYVKLRTKNPKLPLWSGNLSWLSFRSSGVLSGPTGEIVLWLRWFWTVHVPAEANQAISRFQSLQLAWTGYYEEPLLRFVDEVEQLLKETTFVRTDPNVDRECISKCIDCIRPADPVTYYYQSNLFEHLNGELTIDWIGLAETCRGYAARVADAQARQAEEYGISIEELAQSHLADRQSQKEDEERQEDSTNGKLNKRNKPSCIGCGRKHIGGVAACTRRTQPGWNDTDLPWAESPSGKAFLALGYKILPDLDEKKIHEMLPGLGGKKIQKIKRTKEHVNNNITKGVSQLHKKAKTTDPTPSEVLICTGCGRKHFGGAATCNRRTHPGWNDTGLPWAESASGRRFRSRGMYVLPDPDPEEEPAENKKRNLSKEVDSHNAPAAEDSSGPKKKQKLEMPPCTGCGRKHPGGAASCHRRHFPGWNDTGLPWAESRSGKRFLAMGVYTLPDPDEQKKTKKGECAKDIQTKVNPVNSDLQPKKKQKPLCTGCGRNHPGGAASCNMRDFAGWNDTGLPWAESPSGKWFDKKGMKVLPDPDYQKKKAGAVATMPNNKAKGKKQEKLSIQQ